MTTETFLQAFKRLIGRIGLPAEVFSDNESNFWGANNQSLELYKLFNIETFQNYIMNYAHDHGMKWHFISPQAPNCLLLKIFKL